MKGETDEPWRSGSNLPEWSTWVAMSSSYVKTKTKRSSFTVFSFTAPNLDEDSKNEAPNQINHGNQNYTDRLKNSNYIASMLKQLRIRMIKKKVFKFADYDLIGLNLDHTVVKFNFNTLVKAQYEYLVQYLITNKLYPQEYFGQITDTDIDFVCRGTFIDTTKGNFLKVDNVCQIIKVSNGTRQLTEQEILKLYGKKKQFHPVADYVAAYMKTYKFSFSPKIQCYMDYTQCAGVLAFAKAVDFTKTHKLKKKLNMKSFWMDIDDGLNAMNKVGSEWDSLMANYELKADPKMASWFAELRKTSSLMLITSCGQSAADLRMTNAFNARWKEMFDCIVYNVNRLSFFRGKSNFCDLEGIMIPFTAEGEYMEGSVEALEVYLKKKLERDPRILYGGGSSLLDILAPRCEVLGLIEEISENDNFFGYDKSENSGWLLSKSWGHLEGESDILTVWGRAIEEKTKFCAPNLNYFINHQTNREYRPHWLESPDKHVMMERVKERIKEKQAAKNKLEEYTEEGSHTKNLTGHINVEDTGKQDKKHTDRSKEDTLQSRKPKEKNKGQGTSDLARAPSPQCFGVKEDSSPNNVDSSGSKPAENDAGAIKDLKEDKATAVKRSGWW